MGPLIQDDDSRVVCDLVYPDLLPKVLHRIPRLLRAKAQLVVAYSTDVHFSLLCA